MRGHSEDGALAWAARTLAAQHAAAEAQGLPPPRAATVCELGTQGRREGLLHCCSHPRRALETPCGEEGDASEAEVRRQVGGRVGW